MTAFQKPTQEQEGQEAEASQARGQLLRHAPPAGDKLQGPPGAAARPLTTGAPAQGYTPASHLDDLPTGALPAASQSLSPAPGQQKKSAASLGVTQRPPEPGVAPQTPPSGNGNRNQPGAPNPPSMSGVPNRPGSSGLLGASNPPSMSGLAGTPNRPNMAGVPNTPAMPAQGPIPQTPQQGNIPGLTMRPPLNGSEQGPQIENGNLILYRSPLFYVRTTNRTGRRSDPLRKPSGHTTVMPKVMPDQDKRMAASETRMMPTVSPINPMKQKRFPIPVWLEAVFILAVLGVAMVAHAYNMFNFPRYELDEGTYISSAWAILHGLITPYPYGYGHPPIGWMQLAGMVQMIGGFFVFGNALNTGRVLMLFYAGGSTLLVYLIARRLGASRITGLLALVMFSLSPLGIAYERQIFLDNIATFWLLLSLYLLVVGNSRLFYIVLGSLAFGIAMLSKEVLIVLMPAMVFALWLHTTKFQRKFAAVAFTYVFIAVASTFILLAVLKGELFPTGFLPWDNQPHLSLIATYMDQGARGQSQGSIAGAWATWINGDKLLVICSVAAPVFNLAVGWWRRKQLLLALLSGSVWLLIVRGGVVLPFYIIPLIPLTALNTAMALNSILEGVVKVLRLDLIRVALIIAAVAGVITLDIKGSSDLFTLHPTKAQTDAIAWVRANVPHSSFIVINSYLYMDLRVAGGAGNGDEATFPHAEVYDNVGGDPAIYQRELQYNWDRIDYIVADSEMITNITNDATPAIVATPGRKAVTGYDLIYQALHLSHSVQVAQFKDDDQGKICPLPAGQTCTPSQMIEQQLVITVYEVIHQVPPPTV